MPRVIVITGAYGPTLHARNIIPQTRPSDDVPEEHDIFDGKEDGRLKVVLTP